jgi:hypothetical protein
MIPEWKNNKYDGPAISKAINSLSGLSGTRNNWIHGVWSRDQATREVVVFNFRAAEDKGRMKPVKAHDIEQHVAAVRTHTKELRRLVPDIP